MPDPAPRARSPLGGQIASSLLQVVVSTLVVLVLYRYVVARLGVDTLGAWSLVIAIGSVMQAGALALPAAITRLVADRRAGADRDATRELVDTAVLMTAVLAVLTSVPALLLGKVFVGFALRGALLGEALPLVAPAVLAFALALITGAYQAALYGAGRITGRNVLLVADSLLHAAACLALVGAHGLAGLVWARVGTNAAMLFVTAVIAGREFPGAGLLPRRFGGGSARLLLRDGVQLQVISLLSLAAEPLAKALLGRFGSASLVGYFEMANRLVIALRTLFVSANQVALPRFARDRLQGAARTRDTLLATYRLTFLSAVPAFVALVVMAPLVSWAWLGSHVPTFVDTLMLLSLAWLANTLAVPAYFASLGTGELRPNLVSHILMSIVNVAGGWVLGSALGGAGVLVAWSAALVVSAVPLLAVNFGRGRIPAGELVPHGLRPLALAATVAALVAFLLYGPAAPATTPDLAASLLAAVTTLGMLGLAMLGRGTRDEIGVLVARMTGPAGPPP